MAAHLAKMDDRVSVVEQLDEEAGPVVLINPFTAAPEDVDPLVAVWTEDAAFTKRQPGNIATQLHRGIAGSATFGNVALRESAAALRAAIVSPEFKAHVAQYPDRSVVTPHRFERVAVPGVCVAWLPPAVHARRVLPGAPVAPTP